MAFLPMSFCSSLPAASVSITAILFEKHKHCEEKAATAGGGWEKDRFK